jgi:hypothetical protein
MNKKIILTLWAVSLLGGASLMAEDKPAAPGDGHAKPDSKNLTPEQKEKFDEHHKKMLEKYDTNKDGKLDDTEREAMKADRKKHHEEMLQKYDANKDGKLDDAERAKMKEDWKKEHGDKK